MSPSHRIVSSALLLTLFAPSLALADSGVMCVGDCAAQPSGSAPDGITTQVTTFNFKVENVNDVCNEDTKVSIKGFKNDPERTDGGPGLTPQGHSELLGIHFPGQAPSSSVSWEFEDETTQTIGFDVETGEDANGCDFRGFSLIIDVCDTGGGCDIFPDGPCENPTRYLVPFRQDGPPIAATAGTSTVKGKITRTLGGQTVGVEGKLFIFKESGCLVGVVDNTSPFAEKQISTEPAWKPTAGEFSLGSLPAGQYIVRARVDGSTQTQSVSVAAGATVTVNFSF